jgi:GTP-binding protein Era
MERKAGPQTVTDARAGRCAIAGRPNVGKSTLLNALVGQKLAIVAGKPQTTRHDILGVHVSERPPTQIAFVDTPGLHRPKNALGRALVETAQGALESADAVSLVVEAPARATADAPPRPHQGDLEALASVARAGKPVVLCVNKIDRLRDKALLLPLLEAWSRMHPFTALVPVSATRGDGLDRLVAALRELLPPGRLYDDPEFVTDRPERFFVAELVREQVIAQLRHEVPHGVGVVVERWQDEGDLVRIDVMLAVEKESQKRIVVGARGRMVKAIGSAARPAIEELVGKRVMLSLWVKVMAGWTGDAAKVRELVSNGGRA